jgi:prevent-host-death family protein
VAILCTFSLNDYNDYRDLLGRFTMDPHENRSTSLDAQIWTVAEAKAKFSELIERAISLGPQTITRKGRTTAVVVGAEEWQRKTKRVGNLAEFFAASPLRGSNLKVRRLKTPPRKITYELPPGH